MNSHTLYIIGNGFDLYHEIKSSFTDFHLFMVTRWPNGEHLSYALESFFPSFNSEGKSMLWSEFEKTLEKIDEDYVFDQCKLGINIEDYENLSKYAYDIEASPSGYFASVLSEMNKCFHTWIDSLIISCKKEYNPHLTHHVKDSLFFTFNYTETLESVYKIPSSNICHIHGKRYETDYIYGHGNSLGFKIDCDNIVEENAYKIINDYYIGLSKKILENIDAHEEFFMKLKVNCIDEIIVYGCSLDDVDLPYIKKIHTCVASAAKWFFSVYNQEDIIRIKKIIEYIGLDSSLCYSFDSKINILTDNSFTHEFYIENFS